MHLRCWVYRRNLSDNQQSPFRSNAAILYKAGFFISAFLAVLFLGLALLCIFLPREENDKRLSLIFIGLFGISEVICFLHCCVPCCRKSNGVSDDEEVYERPRSSLPSSKEKSYQEVPGYNGIASYQASAGYPEVPSYQKVPGYQEIHSYQAGSIYREVPNYQPLPSGAEGGNFPGVACLRPLVNYEGVFVHQQIPIYHQDLIEPQLPPYSSGYIQDSNTFQSDILVY